VPHPASIIVTGDASGLRKWHKWREIERRSGTTNAAPDFGKNPMNRPFIVPDLRFNVPDATVREIGR
jgi:hypothetical protein